MTPKTTRMMNTRTSHYVMRVQRAGKDKAKSAERPTESWLDWKVHVDQLSNTRRRWWRRRRTFDHINGEWMNFAFGHWSWTIELHCGADLSKVNSNTTKQPFEYIPSKQTIDIQIESIIIIWVYVVYVHPHSKKNRQVCCHSKTNGKHFKFGHFKTNFLFLLLCDHIMKWTIDWSSKNGETLWTSSTPMKNVVSQTSSLLLMKFCFDIQCGNESFLFKFLPSELWALKSLEHRGDSKSTHNEQSFRFQARKKVAWNLEEQCGKVSLCWRICVHIAHLISHEMWIWNTCKSPATLLAHSD